jgi:hypothetical protein
MAMALSDTFYWAFWSAGIYKIIGDVAQTTSPLVMRQIITLVQQSNAAKLAGEPLPGIGRGIGLAVGLFLMQVYVRIPPAMHSGEADCEYCSRAQSHVGLPEQHFLAQRPSWRVGSSGLDRGIVCVERR